MNSEVGKRVLYEVNSNDQLRPLEVQGKESSRREKMWHENGRTYYQSSNGFRYFVSDTSSNCEQSYLVVDQEQINDGFTNNLMDQFGNSVQLDEDDKKMMEIQDIVSSVLSEILQEQEQQQQLLTFCQKIINLIQSNQLEDLNGNKLKILMKFLDKCCSGKQPQLDECLPRCEFEMRKSALQQTLKESKKEIQSWENLRMVSDKLVDQYSKIEQQQVGDCTDTEMVIEGGNVNQNPLFEESSDTLGDRINQLKKSKEIMYQKQLLELVDFCDAVQRLEELLHELDLQLEELQLSNLQQRFSRYDHLHSPQVLIQNLSQTQE